MISLGNVLLYWVVIFYGFVFWLTWAKAHPDHRLARWQVGLTPAVLCAGLAVLTILVWREAFAAPDGRHLLINGGPSASRLSDTP